MTMPASEPRLIRFIDSEYSDLFFLPDGANIRLIHAHGEVRILPCKYLDAYHLKVGNEAFHICQFTELMERNGTQYQPDMPLPLPERCHALHPETGELIVLRRGKRGYTVSPFSQKDAQSNQRLADQENGAGQIGRQQVTQMLSGAFEGWKQETPKRKSPSHDR